MTTYTEQLLGLNGYVAVKAPVRVATTAAITLSGLQTIDGIVLIAGDRVLVKNQADSAENGIYTAGPGAWARTADFNGARDVVTGTEVLVASGTTNGLVSYVLTSPDPVTIGTSDILFSAHATDTSSPRVEVASFAEVGTTDRITSATASVWVASYYDGGSDSGFHMRKVASAPTHGIGIQNTATSTYWEPVPVAPAEALTGYMVGLKREASFFDETTRDWYTDAGFNTLATDDTAKLQALTNAAFYQYKCNVSLGTGQCRTTDTLHIGYGTSSFEQFKSGLHFYGAGATRRGESQNVGFAFCPNFSDRPVINIQGARKGVRVGAFSILGTIHEYEDIDRTNKDFTVEANWTTYQAFKQYNQGAGITVDAYAGTAPGGSDDYPDVTFPSFLGHDDSQYGKGAGSDATIYGVYMRYLPAGIIIQPNADGNGDFMGIESCNIERCMVAISAGNSQARNMEVSKRCILNANYIGITGSRHGAQLGQFSVIDNCQISQNAYQFEFPSTFPVTVSNCDGESVYKIARIVGSSSNDAPLLFIGCRVDFTHSDAIGHPCEIFEGSASTIAKPIIWHGGEIVDFTSVFDVGVATKFRCTGNVRVKSSTRGSGSASHYIALAHNDMAGGLSGQWTSTVLAPAQSIETPRFDLSTDTISGVMTTDPDRNEDTGRKFGVSRYQHFALYGSEAFLGPERFQRRAIRSEAKSGWTVNSFTKSGTEYQLDITRTAGIADGESVRFGMYVGGTFKCTETNMDFFIKTRSGANLVAVAQNNYRDDGASGYETINTFSNGTGNYLFQGTGYYRPGSKIDEVQHNTSNAVTNFVYSITPSFLSDATTGIATGDSYVNGEIRDRVHLATGATDEGEITAFDTAAKTITFAGANPRFTKTLPFAEIQRF